MRDNKEAGKPFESLNISKSITNMCSKRKATVSGSDSGHISMPPGSSDEVCDLHGLLLGFTVPYL